ncbi:Canalicular multispecific organic anion transporter 1 [Homalodisca vitripennis]|nr:Canalicular multispecific organic anion transporter 1 [Homalodisca vitripennis]
MSVSKCWAVGGTFPEEDLTSVDCSGFGMISESSLMFRSSVKNEGEGFSLSIIACQLALGVMMLCCVVDIFFGSENRDFTLVDKVLSYPFLKLFTFSLAFIIQNYSRRALKLSGILFMFWLLYTIFGTLQLYLIHVQDNKLCTEEISTFPTKITFFWCVSLLRKGCKTTLNLDHLLNLYPKQALTSINGKTGGVSETVKQILKTFKNRRSPCSVFGPILKAIRSEFVFAASLKFCSDFLTFCNIFLLK